MESRFLHRLSRAGLPVQTVPPLGSVGVLAARLAVQQEQPIFLAGLDFMFRRGITHCKGSPSDLVERQMETRLYKQGRNWSLSFAEGVVPATGGGLGNAILSMYADSAEIELKNAAVYDLRGGFGLPLPATAVTPDQAQELLAASQFYRDKSDGITSFLAMDSKTMQNTEKNRTLRAAAVAFLEHELALARNLADRLRTSSKDRLGDLVLDCDYMYAHFPDPQRVEALESDALNRLALEAGYWQHRLQTALSLPGS
jgi:hypothetical protein